MAEKEKTEDISAGVPAEMDEAVERLPEKDPVQKAYKQQMEADTADQEIAAKKVIVQKSPDAPETPSGAALLSGAKGDDYARVKRAVRLGSVEDAKSVR